MSLLTLGDLKKAAAEQLGRDVSSQQIKYAVEVYHVEPVQRAGVLRLWSPAQVPAVVSALRRIAGRKGVGCGR